MIARFFATPQMVQDENKMITDCNKVKHKLIVTHYMSGDDRDHWNVKCSECSGTFGLSSGIYEPDLNYCPYCSPKEELIGENIWNGKDHDAFEMEPDNIDKYVYEIWNGYNSSYTKALARYHAADTPEYK